MDYIIVLQKKTYTNKPGKNLGNSPRNNCLSCSKTDLPKLAQLANKLRTIDFLKIKLSTILVGNQTQDHCFSKD